MERNSSSSCSNSLSLSEDQVSVGKSTFETAPLHVTSVVVQHHLEHFRANPRFLSRGFAPFAEGTRGHNPRCDRQTEAVAKDEKQKGGKGDEDWHRRSAELFKQANRSFAVACRTVVSQSLSAARRIHRDRRQ